MVLCGALVCRGVMNGDGSGAVWCFGVERGHERGREGYCVVLWWVEGS